MNDKISEYIKVLTNEVNQESSIIERIEQIETEGLGNNGTNPRTKKTRNSTY